MMDMTIGTFAGATGAIILGAVLQAATGLGAGLIIVPLLALISLEFVPGPLIFASLALSCLMAWRGRDEISFADMRLLLAGLGAGILAGAASLSAIPVKSAGLVFGVLVLLAVAITAIGPRIRRGPATLLTGGILSGFMGTTSAIGAPVLALMYQHEDGKVLRATLAFLYFVSAVAMLTLLHFTQHFGMRELHLGLYLVPGFVIGYFLGAPLAKALDRGYARLAILILSVVSACVLVWRSV
jgi:uncharacterized protein